MDKLREVLQGMTISNINKVNINVLGIISLIKKSL